MIRNNVIRLLKILPRPIRRRLKAIYSWFQECQLLARLSYSQITEWVMFELTSRCNLRCVYCRKSSDPKESARAFDFPEEKVLPAINLLRERQLRLIQMSGIGETTARKGWHLICRQSLGNGIEHTIITNLARPISEEEADTLARFASVQVSVDTADPVLFAQIRRGAKLDTVLANIDHIKASSRKLGISGPELRFDMVITDKTVLGLVETVRLGLRHGVTDFYFAGLFKNKDVTNGINVYPVKSLPRPQLEEALHCLERSIDLVQKAGCKLQVHEGLIQSVHCELAKENGSSKTTESMSNIPTWGAPPLEPGYTRDCLDPWRLVFLYAHGDVCPCCAYDKSIGDHTKTPLEKILNGSPARKMRRKLLTGKLHGMMCAQCSMRSPIRIEDLRKKAEIYCAKEAATAIPKKAEPRENIRRAA
ncbi:MAG: radical SAM protein [Thermoguttaceae bacterium]|jgi:MoaA/NifB/PqqE/SkfB family radical SAM enzyme